MRKSGRPILPSPAPVRRTKLVTLILNQLRDYVITHSLVEEDRLPPERELASQLNVSRPSLRNALDWLSERGALRRVQGGGTFLQSNFLLVLTQTYGDAEPSQDRLREVAQARALLEPILTRLAAEKMSQSEIAALQADVARAESRIDDYEAWRQHDLSFHVRLSRLAGNAILADTLDSLFPHVLKLWQARPEYFNRPQCLAGHRAIVESLARHDAEGAVRWMQRHLESFQRAANAGPLRVSA